MLFSTPLLFVIGGELMRKILSEERFKAFHQILPKYFSWDVILQENKIDAGSDKGDQYEITCPFHADKRPSMRLNKVTGVYHCFSCGRKGTYVRFIWELMGKQISYSDFCEEVLKAHPSMQHELGFVSLYITATTLDKEFTERQVFDPASLANSPIPYTTLVNKVRAIDDTWENLVLSLSLLQSGIQTDGVLTVVQKQHIDVKVPKKRVSALDLLMSNESGGASD